VQVIKSRVQATSQPWATVAQQLIACEGYSALSKGMGATLAKAFVVNAAILYGYASACRYLEHVLPESS